MSTTTIGYTLLKNGVPYDATSVKLKSPTGVSPAYGLKRTDNDAILVATNTSYTQVGTGLYEYVLTDPAPDLQYNYWREVVVDAQTISQNLTKTGSQSVTTPTALYWTYDEFIRRWGLKNVAKVSNKDSTSAIAPDLETIQDSFDFAVDEIHNTLRGGVLTVPLDFSLWSGAIPATVARWGMILAYADLYDVRGWEDKSLTGNKLSRQLSETYRDMGCYKAGLKQLNAAPATDTAGNAISLDARATPLNRYFNSEINTQVWSVWVPDGVLSWFSNYYYAA